MALTLWTLASVTANADTDLLTVTAGQTAMILGIEVANYSGSTAAIKVWIADGSNNVKSYIYPSTSLSDGGAAADDNKHVVPAEYKIRVRSDQANVSFEASGDMS